MKPLTALRNNLELLQIYFIRRIAMGHKLDLNNCCDASVRDNDQIRRTATMAIYEQLWLTKND